MKEKINFTKNQRHGEEAVPQENIVAGRNAVRELLRSERGADRLYAAHDAHGGSIGDILSLARERGIIVTRVPSSRLDAICGEVPHQGVAAVASDFAYAELEDILKKAEDAGEAPFILIADGINDPHNLGAVCRCADAAGVHGIIIPKRRAVQMTAAAIRASAGAAEHVLIARETNLAVCVDSLKKKGLWIYAAEAGGTDYNTCDMTGAAAFIIGSEGRGVSALLREKSDFTVSIPMRGQVNSLNVSCACAVILCEAARQRNQKSNLK